MILKLNFIIIGHNSHINSRKLESYDSLENELQSLSEEKPGSGSSTVQQVHGTFSRVEIKFWTKSNRNRILVLTH